MKHSMIPFRLAGIITGAESRRFREAGVPRQWKMDSKPLGVPIHTKPQQVNFWSHPCHPEKGIHVFVGEKILPKKFLANGPTIDLLDNNDYHFIGKICF